MDRIEKTIVVEKVDEVFVRINCSLEQGYEIKNYFSCYTNGYKWHPKFKARLWDGKVSFFNMKNQTLPIGLLKKFDKFAEEYEYPITYTFNREPDSVCQDDLDLFYKEIFVDSKFYPRDYQNKAILNSINHGRGVLEMATGSGKSLIIYCLIRFMLASTEGKIILVVPSVMLTQRMFSDFVSYGWKNAFTEVSILYSDKDRYDPSKRILITTWQSVYKKDQEYFDKFESVIIDESHSAKAESLKSILSKCTKASFRIGTTGTLPTESVDKYSIFGFLGPVISTVKSIDLMELGILAKIKIINVFLKYSEKEINKSKKMTYAEEERFIHTHPNRNAIFSFILKNIDKDENTLILCSKIEHLKSIVAYLEFKFKDRKIVQIHGSVDYDKREDIRQSLDNEKGTILVGSYGTMKQGVNIKKLHNVIFASSYKSKITVLQSIGRGLRTHEEKSELKLWDIIDDMRYEKRTGTIGTNYIFDHFMERLSYYKDQSFTFINKHITMDNLFKKEILQ